MLCGRCEGAVEGRTRLLFVAKKSGEGGSDI